MRDFPTVPMIEIHKRNCTASVQFMPAAVTVAPDYESRSRLVAEIGDSINGVPGETLSGGGSLLFRNLFFVYQWEWHIDEDFLYLDVDLASELISVGKIIPPTHY